MEEKVGEYWHKLITGIANEYYPQSAVQLIQLRDSLAVYFRALGGDSGLQIEAVDLIRTNRRRSWAQRIAGSGSKIELARRDENVLKLPTHIAWFEKPSLNRDLYYWLAAMAANSVQIQDPQNDHWLARNQLMVLLSLKRYPGLIKKYTDLIEAHFPRRPNPAQLPKNERLLELQIREALLEPGSVKTMARCTRDPYPVPLWLYPDQYSATTNPQVADHENENHGAKQTRELEDIARRQAERVNTPDEDRGLITVRMENIFTWGEFVNLDRGNEDQDDSEQAEAVARDLDVLSVTRNQRSAAIRLKFDLDLPSSEADDEVLTEGLLLPEWDWKKNTLLAPCCRVVEMTAADVQPVELPEELRKTARKLRNQFQLLAPSRVWVHRQNDGQEIDLDAYLRYEADKRAGGHVSSDGLYREQLSGNRDLSCLLLADLSLSTDSWVNNQQRVIDVIRDSLFLFAESLSASGDMFSMLGFSSRKRDPIRVHILKTFKERYGTRIRGRIAKIKPGYYTRLGAGIRYASRQIQQGVSGRRLLLILSDGKPNDLDQYEGRYGIEDTRHAVQEARREGLQVFCVTIDQKGNQYLPHLFGSNGYVVVKNPLQMPTLLPRLYAQLTR